MKIGIKRKWWFGYRDVECTRFYFSGEVKGIDGEGNPQLIQTLPWLVLHLVGGIIEVVPDIENRGYRLYPEPIVEPKTEVDQVEAQQTRPANFYESEETHGQKV